MSFIDKLQQFCCSGRKPKESIQLTKDLLLCDQMSTEEITKVQNLKQCQKTLKYKQRKPWNKEEDNLLLELYHQFPQNWQQISKFMNGRSGKQIRDRYINALDSNINKNEWTHEEDLKILYKYIEFGSKWSQIALYLKGRPENMIKNRFYSSIKKRITKGDFEINFKNNQNISYGPQQNQNTIDNYQDYQSQYDIKLFDLSEKNQDCQQQSFIDQIEKTIISDQKNSNKSEIALESSGQCCLNPYQKNQNNLTQQSNEFIHNMANNQNNSMEIEPFYQNDQMEFKYLHEDSQHVNSNFLIHNQQQIFQKFFTQNNQIS